MVSSPTCLGIRVAPAVRQARICPLHIALGFGEAYTFVLVARIQQLEHPARQCLVIENLVTGLVLNFASMPPAIYEIDMRV